MTSSQSFPIFIGSLFSFIKQPIISVPFLQKLSFHCIMEFFLTTLFFTLPPTLLAVDVSNILCMLSFMSMFNMCLGTMSGGGKTVLRGRMGQSVAVTSSVGTPRKLDQMEQKLQQLESRARQLCTRQVSLEDQVTLLSQQLQTMRMNLNKFNMEIQVCLCP